MAGHSSKLTLILHHERRVEETLDLICFALVFCEDATAIIFHSNEVEWSV